MVNDKTIAFLGTGNMAGAIISALDTGKIVLFDKDTGKYDRFSGRNYYLAASAADAVNHADYVFLSVKPQQFPELLESISTSGVSLEGKCFVSIAAGISTDYITDRLGESVHVIRTMPNTPLLYGKGVTALCRNMHVTDGEFSDIMSVFSSCGTAFVLEEKDMNKVISATSSSPAYVYLFIKAIVDGIAKQGLALDRDVICDMVIGSAEMVKKSDLSLDELIKMVTSKGGTTEQALRVFNEGGFEKLVSDAMEACSIRADELGK